MDGLAIHSLPDRPQVGHRMAGEYAGLDGSRDAPQKRCPGLHDRLDFDGTTAEESREDKGVNRAHGRIVRVHGVYAAHAHVDGSTGKPRQIMSLRRQKMSEEQDAAARRLAGPIDCYFVGKFGGVLVSEKLAADYGVTPRTADRWRKDLPPSPVLALMREREGERFRRVLAGAEVGVLRFRRPRGDDAGGNA